MWYYYSNLLSLSSVLAWHTFTWWIVCQRFLLLISSAFSHYFSDVITALKRLQEKFAKLELDRIKAEENLKHLTSETDEYKTILQRDRELSESAQSAIEIQKRGNIFIRCMLTKIDAWIGYCDFAGEPALATP